MRFIKVNCEENSLACEENSLVEIKNKFSHNEKKILTIPQERGKIVK